MEKVAAFSAYLAQLGYQKSSLQMLPSCVAEFLEQHPKTIEEISPEDILSYYQYLQNRPNKRSAGGLSERFIQHHIYSLRVFFSWQMTLGNLERNPISGLDFPRPKSKAREILNQEEIQKLYEQSKDLRQKAILNLCYGCGLRRSEAENLELRDVHFRSNFLYVRKGKAGKRRVVPIQEKVKKDLLEYVLKERKSNPKTTTFLTSFRGKPLKGNTMNREVKNLVEAAEIKKNISLHSLRHSIATHLLENGLSLEYVRDFLGHQHLETTQIYTKISIKVLHEIAVKKP